MIEYSMTFIFNKSLSKILLIKKNKPLLMAGFLNGIGGHKESEDNSYEDCAVREIKEECDLNLEKTELIKIHELTDLKKYYVAVFAAIIEEKRIQNFKSLTSEYVYYLTLNEIDHISLYIDAQTCIKIALEKLKP